MRLSEVFFLLTLAAVPVQLGKFYWTSQSFVLGIPINYLAVNLYLVDLPLVAYLVTFTVENVKNFRKDDRYQKNFILAWFLLILYLTGDAIFFSKAPVLSYWFLVRFFAVAVFGLYATRSLKNQKLFKASILIIAVSAIWQSTVVLGQFLLQRSLGLWILGERSFDSSTVNIAHFELFGRQLLRPYGTFPHPNVAAAYLVISFIILKSQRSSIKQKTLTVFAVASSFLSTVITYSKSAAIILALYFVTSTKKIYFVLGFAVIAVIIWFAIGLLPDAQIATVAERLVLIQASLDILSKTPLFGIGSATFIPELARQNLISVGEIRLLQPVHNVFLLILAENGILGLIFFALLLLSVLKKATTPGKTLLFVSLLVFLSFDHFLWTLNQGRLLFWLICAYIISSPKDN